MAPSPSTLTDAFRVNTFVMSKLIAMGQSDPPIPLEQPQNNKGKSLGPLNGNNPNVVCHKLHYQKGIDDTYEKYMFKLRDDSTPEEYCFWRQEIASLLMAKEKFGAVSIDYKRTLILASMNEGERATLFNNSCEQYLREELRQLAKEAQEAAAKAARKKEKEKEKESSKDEESVPGDNPQAQSAKKKKKKDKKKEAEVEAEVEIVEVPRKDVSDRTPPVSDVSIWRALNDLGLKVFPEGAKAYKVQKYYLTNLLQCTMGDQKTRQMGI